jgi:hypothetical protein
MLDARYWMLDIQEYTGNENQKHPVSLRGAGFVVSTSRRPETSIKDQSAKPMVFAEKP